MQLRNDHGPLYKKPPGWRGRKKSLFTNGVHYLPKSYRPAWQRQAAHLHCAGGESGGLPEGRVAELPIAEASMSRGNDGGNGMKGTWPRTMRVAG